jgi:hypothetical protein
VYWKLLKNGGRELKGEGSVFEGTEQTKVNHTHRGHTLRHPFEHQPNY